jgi:glycosyltransferase involved in cell wall biosynthesis
MPVYNGERTIRRAIRSLLGQRYPLWGAVIVDDGSSDKTREILSAYEDDPRFVIVSLQENKGRGYARQVALDHAEGDFIAFLDADDFYHPAKLERQVGVMVANEQVDLVSTAIGCFDRQQELISVRALGNATVMVHGPAPHVNSISPATIMLRAPLAKRTSYRMFSVGEDVDYIERLLVQRSSLSLREVLYYYEEIGVTNARKLFQYQFEAMRTSWLKLKGKPLSLLSSLLVRSAKISYYAVAVSLRGTERVIAARGRRPTEAEKAEFEQAKRTAKVSNRLAGVPTDSE